MNKQQLRGAANQASGSIKREVGKLTGDRSLTAKGQARDLKGKVQKSVGDARELARSDRELRQERQSTRSRKI